MSLMHMPLDKITEQDLLALVENKVTESKYIEYKVALPGKADRDKREFLADVTSFANASGGDIIFGIREEGGVPIEICGLKQINIDRETARLENIIRDGISPRITGKQIRAIELQNGAVIIILRIMRSWALPHMVVFQRDFRFYTRNTNGKHAMDVSEIRAAITLSETMMERIRNFRLTRLSMITSGEAPLHLPYKTVIVLHIVPLNAFDPSIQVDLKKAQEKAQLLRPIYGGIDGARYNADGFLVYDATSDGKIYAYTQVFRNGIIESTNTYILAKNSKIIPSTILEENLIISVGDYINFLNISGVGAPILIMVSMLGVRGLKMGVDHHRFYVHNTTIDRDDIIIPEVLVEKLDLEPDVILKPILDVIWNAAGWPGSIYYKDGKWVGNSRL